jgi:hypothetical protein
MSDNDFVGFDGFTFGATDRDNRRTTNHTTQQSDEKLRKLIDRLRTGSGIMSERVGYSGI